MLRIACIAAALAASVSLPLQAAEAAVTLGGRINQIVNALRDGAHFSPRDMRFSIDRPGGAQTLFAGIQGVRAFHDMLTLNDWLAEQAAQQSVFEGGPYRFTHDVLDSYFGDAPAAGANPFQGGGYRFTHSVLGSYFDPPLAPPAGLSVRAQPLGEPVVTPLVAGAAVPEPASWAMMIGGFALAGAALRRRRRMLRPA
jgi:hypothetical protein